LIFVGEEGIEKMVQNGIDGYGSQVEGLPQALIIIFAQNSLKQATIGFPVVATRFPIVNKGCPDLLQET